MNKRADDKNRGLPSHKLHAHVFLISKKDKYLDLWTGLKVGEEIQPVPALNEKDYVRKICPLVRMIIIHTRWRHQEQHIP